MSSRSTTVFAIGGCPTAPLGSGIGPVAGGTSIALLSGEGCDIGASGADLVEFGLTRVWCNSKNKCVGAALTPKVDVKVFPTDQSSVSHDSGPYLNIQGLNEIFDWLGAIMPFHST